MTKPWKPVVQPVKSKEQESAESYKKLATQFKDPKMRAACHGMAGQLTRQHNANQKKAETPSHGVSEKWIRDRILSGAEKLSGSRRDRELDMNNTADAHMGEGRKIATGHYRDENEAGPMTELQHRAAKKRMAAGRAAREAANKIGSGPAKAKKR